MKILWMLFYVVVVLYSAEISQKTWKSGEAFSTYLEKNGIGLGLLRRISVSDQELLLEIQAGEWFYELRKEGRLLQALIPVGKEMQIHISRDIGGERFHFDIVPMDCRQLTDYVSFSVVSGLSEDVYRWTRNPRLGYLLKKYYGKSVNFRTLHRGDKISFIYSQRSRLGKPFGSPKIRASLIQGRGKNRFIFADKDNTYYDAIHKNILYGADKIVQTGGDRLFVKPISKMRITSKFTYKRWHPILKRYRPHLGVDIGAKRGTKIYAIHAGKVIYAGWMGGYGKATKIRHSRGFVSLYAHQSRLTVTKGQYVKRGQVIGYVGNTGRSTAPHLHFGLYENAKAVNPMQYIGRKALSRKRIEIKKITKHKIVEIPGARNYKRQLLKLVEGEARAFRWQTYDRPYNRIEERSKYEKPN